MWAADVVIERNGIKMPNEMMNGIKHGIAFSCLLEMVVRLLFSHACFLRLRKIISRSLLPIPLLLKYPAPPPANRVTNR